MTDAELRDNVAAKVYAVAIAVNRLLPPGKTPFIDPASEAFQYAEAFMRARANRQGSYRDYIGKQD